MIAGNGRVLWRFGSVDRLNVGGRLGNIRRVAWAYPGELEFV